MDEMSFILISDDTVISTSIRSPLQLNSEKKQKQIEREQTFSICKDTKSMTPTYNGVMLPNIVRALGIPINLLKEQI